MFSVLSVPDLFLGLVMWLGDIVIAAVNGAWSALDLNRFHDCMYWFGRLNKFLPVSEFFTVLAWLFALAALSLIIKFGIKAVDWIRG